MRNVYLIIFIYVFFFAPQMLMKYQKRQIRSLMCNRALRKENKLPTVYCWPLKKVILKSLVTSVTSPNGRVFPYLTLIDLPWPKAWSQQVWSVLCVCLRKISKVVVPVLSMLLLLCVCRKTKAWICTYKDHCKPDKCSLLPDLDSRTDFSSKSKRNRKRKPKPIDLSRNV